MMKESPEISTKELEKPSEAEIAAAVETLSGLERGHLPYPLFLQLARLATLSTVELVPIRNNGVKPEVLLLQRPANDIWEHQWHVPGTVILPTDPLAHPHDFSAPLSRLIGDNGELKSGVNSISAPVFVDSERRKTKRGDEMAAIHYIEVEGEPEVGRFFSIDVFPGNVPEAGVIDHHVGFIERTVKRYLEDKRRMS